MGRHEKANDWRAAPRLASLTLGEAGLHVDSNFVPDISIGKAWSQHWTDNNFDALHGTRIKWEHNYPDMFPQAASNPQHPWCYPEVALGEFRRWLREDYIGSGKFATYINTKIKQRELPPSFAQLMIAAYKLDGREGE